MQWLCGDPSQARATANAAVAWADELAHPPTTAVALTLAAWVQALGHEWHAVEETAARASSLAAEYGLVFFAAIAAIQRGCALAALDRGAEADELLHAGLRGYCATGAGTNEVAYRMLAVEAYLHLGRMEAAHRELDAGFDAMERHGERHVEADLLRLKGELILADDPCRGDAAGHCFHAAIEVARGQGATSLALRAERGLARLQGPGAQQGNSPNSRRR